MQYWMISANGKMYDHASAFEKWGYIDWRQNRNYEIGDIVYIYCTKPIKKLMYKTQVVKESMLFSEITDDKEFWIVFEEYEKARAGRYARLKLIGQVDREELSLERLKENGLSAAPQGPIRVKDELRVYIDKYLKDDYAENVFPESSIPEKSYEGAVTQALVNRYERSSIARSKCISFHGVSCGVCGMNFEEKYGIVGKGFIHVHHIVPLNTIGEEYLVDYEKDLIPVCPNCHAMLHRKVNGKELTVEELKELLNKQST